MPTPRPVRQTSLIRAGFAAAILTALVAACGGAAATPSPTPVEITAAPTLPPSPSPAASAAPSEAAAGGPSSSPSVRIEGTTGTVVNETDGYTIALPDGWLRLDLSAGDLTAILKTAAGMSDDMAAMMHDQAATMAVSGVHFWAIKTNDVGQGFASNVNIIRQPSMGVSLDLIEQLSVNQLESLDVLGGAKVAHQHVKLPAGEAIRLSYTIKAKDASNADTTATIVHFIPISI